MANGVPHFVQGICGNKFQTPFARPRGIGESSALVNAGIWGWFNFNMGGVRVRLSFPPLPPPPALSLATMLGVLVMAILPCRVTSGGCATAPRIHEVSHAGPARAHCRFPDLRPARAAPTPTRKART